MVSRGRVIVWMDVSVTGGKEVVVVCVTGNVYVVVNIKVDITVLVNRT